MRANDISQAAYEAEKELTSKIYKAVEEVINGLSEKTGLTIDGINIRLVDSTTLSSQWKEYRLARVHIERSLPDPISRCTREE